MANCRGAGVFVVYGCKLKNICVQIYIFFFFLIIASSPNQPGNLLNKSEFFIQRV